MSEPVWKNPPIYGKYADTGQLSIRVVVGYQKIGPLTDPSTVELRVEVWSSRPIPIGNEQRRCHATESLIPAPVTESSYMSAYKGIVTGYEDYWKDLGCEPPKDWKETLARACGSAMGQFMSR